MKEEVLEDFVNVIPIGVLDNRASKVHNEPVNECSGDILNQIVVRMPTCKIDIEEQGKRSRHNDFIFIELWH